MYRRPFSKQHAKAVTHSPDTVPERAKVFHDLPHSAPHLFHFGSGARRGKSGVKRCMHGGIGTRRIVGDVAKAIVSIKVTKIPVERCSGIDDQHVAALKRAPGRTHDDAVVAALARSRHHKRSVISTPLQEINSHFAGDVEFRLAD